MVFYAIGIIVKGVLSLKWAPGLPVCGQKVTGIKSNGQKKKFSLGQKVTGIKSNS